MSYQISQLRFVRSRAINVPSGIMTPGLAAVRQNLEDEFVFEGALEMAKIDHKMAASKSTWSAFPVSLFLTIFFCGPARNRHAYRNLM